MIWVTSRNLIISCCSPPWSSSRSPTCTWSWTRLSSVSSLTTWRWWHRVTRWRTTRRTRCGATVSLRPSTANHNGSVYLPGCSATWGQIILIAINSQKVLIASSRPSTSPMIGRLLIVITNSSLIGRSSSPYKTIHNDLLNNCTLMPSPPLGMNWSRLSSRALLMSSARMIGSITSILRCPQMCPPYRTRFWEVPSWTRRRISCGRHWGNQVQIPTRRSYWSPWIANTWRIVSVPSTRWRWWIPWNLMMFMISTTKMVDRPSWMIRSLWGSACRANLKYPVWSVTWLLCTSSWHTLHPRWRARIFYKSTQSNLTRPCNCFPPLLGLKSPSASYFNDRRLKWSRWASDPTKPVY